VSADAIVLTRWEVAASGTPSFADAAASEPVRGAVFRYLLYRTGRRDAAEDLFQETYLRAFREWERFDPRRGSVKRWLLLIARRTLIDRARSERAREAREVEYAREQRTLGGGAAPDPAEPRGVPEELRAAMARLGEVEREVLVLRVVVGMDTAEAAHLMGISPTNCSTILSRAVARLRREVGDALP
jgi:RNA polymerase sigma-70 factor, ECF subfamily